MKTLLSIIIGAVFFGAFTTNISRADSRNVLVYTPDNHKIEYSIGSIQTMNEVGGKPLGGWTPQPYNIQNPGSIIGSHTFSQILPLTSTQPFDITSDPMQISFNLVVSADDPSVSTSTYASASSVALELVDANSGSVLATAYSCNSLSNASWVQGSGSNGTMQTYNIDQSLAGHSAYVRMNVTWDATDYGTGTFDAFATSNTDQQAYVAMLPVQQQSSSQKTFVVPLFSGRSLLKAANNAEVASAATLYNAPNPVVNATTIHVQTASMPVSLKVYDMQGRMVADLSSSLTTNTTMDILFNTSMLQSGAYIYRLVTVNGTMQHQLFVTR